MFSCKQRMCTISNFIRWEYEIVRLSVRVIPNTAFIFCIIFLIIMVLHPHQFSIYIKICSFIPIWRIYQFRIILKFETRLAIPINNFVFILLQWFCWIILVQSSITSPPFIFSIFTNYSIKFYICVYLIFIFSKSIRPVIIEWGKHNTFLPFRRHRNVVSLYNVILNQYRNIFICCYRETPIYRRIISNIVFNSLIISNIRLPTPQFVRIICVFSNLFTSSLTI